MCTTIEQHARTGARKKGSAQATGPPIGVRGDHRAPYSTRLHTLSYGFVNGAPVESRKSLIRGEAPRITGAESLLEAPPEVCQPHTKKPTRGVRAAPPGGWLRCASLCPD